MGKRILKAGRLSSGWNEMESVNCPVLCLTHGGLWVNKSGHYHPLAPCLWHYVGFRGVMERPSWKLQVGVIGERNLSFTQDSPSITRASLISSKDTLQQAPGGCRRLRVSPATCICCCQTNCSLIEVLWPQRQRRVATTSSLGPSPLPV